MILCFQSNVVYFLFQALITAIFSYIIHPHHTELPSPKARKDTPALQQPARAGSTARSKYQAVTLTCQHSTLLLSSPSFGRHTETLLDGELRKFIQLRRAGLFSLDNPLMLLKSIMCFGRSQLAGCISAQNGPIKTEGFVSIRLLNKSEVSPWKEDKRQLVKGREVSNCIAQLLVAHSHPFCLCLALIPCSTMSMKDSPGGWLLLH